MKENEHILRATKSDYHEAVYWKDGGLDIKLGGRWFTRFDEGYVRADELRSRFLEDIKKEDVTIKKATKSIQP